MSLPDDAVLDRALGAYLGFALGDALGATVEFLTPGEIARDHGVHDKIIGGGWLRLKAGEVTDDTQMSLVLGDAIVAHGGWDLRAVADGFAAWLRSRPIDVGNTCRRGIARYMRDGSLVAAPHEAHGGNGACMRNLPVVLYGLVDDALFERCTLEQCHFTHHHALSDAASLALGRMARLLIRGASPAQARDIAERLVAQHRCFRFEPYPERTTGYVVDTVQTVLHGFFTTQSFRDCLVKVVNLGGDADTNGAIAGMLAGARYGLDGLPRPWLRRLKPDTAAAIRRQTTALLALAGVRVQGWRTSRLCAARPP